MRQKKEKAHSLFSSTEMPIFEGGRIEVTESGAEKELLILGVHRILRFGEEEMIFARKRDRVSVCGRALVCISYASGAVGIRGQVSSLFFSGKEE